MTRKLTLLAVFAFEIALILFVAAWTASAATGDVYYCFSGSAIEQFKGGVFDRGTRKHTISWNEDEVVLKGSFMEEGYYDFWQKGENSFVAVSKQYGQQQNHDLIVDFFQVVTLAERQAGGVDYSIYSIRPNRTETSTGTCEKFK